MKKYVFEDCKKFLQDEYETVLDIVKDWFKYRDELQIDKKYVTVIPISSEHMIILQMSGWSINLLDDGTWFWEGTDGG